MKLDPVLQRLDNGVRIAAVPMPHMESVSIGLWTDVGSRHESEEEHGMAHFIEHMLFKGTPSRTCAQISREIEGLGSSIDGFTVEDHTGYQAKAPAGKFDELFSVLADFYRNPTIDPTDLEHERLVIHEEIAMVRDQPSQFIEDIISEAAWGANHPLGRSITGTNESLDAFSRGDVLQFFQRAYCGANTVISVAGNVEPDAVFDAVSREFADLGRGRKFDFEAAPSPLSGHRYEEVFDPEQTHLSLAFPGVARSDRRRYARKLLDVILGENMSSRLFQELREKRALCYEVQSDLVSFSDEGLLQIYVAVTTENLSEALEGITNVVSGLAQDGVTEQELETAKSYLVGQSRVSLENTASRMMWAGECLLFFDDWIDPAEVHRKIEAVTLEEVHLEAMRVFSGRQFSSALIGPIEANGVLEDWRETVG